ncbi:hypothetical protein SFC50_16110 [Bacillus infantis]|uniref:hypothetical protein n=1 Tax=Bacillus infantis TaxID=324767 RepID=UPI003982432D
MERKPELVFFNLTEDGHVYRTEDGPKLNLYAPIIFRKVNLPYTLNYTISICLFDVDKTVVNLLQVRIYDEKGNLVHTYEGELNEVEPDDDTAPIVVFGTDDVFELTSAGRYKVEVFINNQYKITSSSFAIVEKSE